MEKAKNQTDMQIYGRLLRYVTPYWAAFVLSIIGFMIYSLANVSFLSLLGYIVNSLGGTDPLGETEAAYLAMKVRSIAQSFPSRSYSLCLAAA